MQGLSFNKGEGGLTRDGGLAEQFSRDLNFFFCHYYIKNPNEGPE